MELFAGLFSHNLGSARIRMLFCLLKITFSQSCLLISTSCIVVMVLQLGAWNLTSSSVFAVCPTQGPLLPRHDTQAASISFLSMQCDRYQSIVILRNAVSERQVKDWSLTDIDRSGFGKELNRPYLRPTSLSLLLLMLISDSKSDRRLSQAVKDAGKAM